jgi:hypothetical protein
MVQAIVFFLLVRRTWYCFRWALRRYNQSAEKGRRANVNFFPRYLYEREYYYDFLGECYVDRMMDGYAVTLQNNSTEKGYKGQKMHNMVFELR